MFLHTALTLCKSVEGFLQLRRIQHSLAQRGVRPPPPSHGPSLISVRLRCLQFRRTSSPCPPCTQGENRGHRVLATYRLNPPQGRAHAQKLSARALSGVHFAIDRGFCPGELVVGLPFLTRVLRAASLANLCWLNF